MRAPLPAQRVPAWCCGDCCSRRRAHGARTLSICILRLWWRSLLTGGLLKWLVLQLLSKLAIPRLRRAGLHTNRRFAGVLFSGSMFGTAFRRCWETAYSSITVDRASQPIVLIHPALPDAASGIDQEAFQQSVAFFNSANRQKEWSSAQQL